VLYLQKVESQHTLRASLTVGSATVPAHCSANGKMLLAQLDASQLSTLLDTHPLESLGPNSIVDRDRLLDELRTIREQGYSVDDLEFAEDIRAVAAPIRDHRGNTIAAVAVAGPASRLTLERTHALAPRVMEMATRISRRLGYQE
jgi:IclR family transcriptional regulator, KDG regulon repressor